MSQSLSPPSSPIIVAMDFDDLDAAIAVAKTLNPDDCRLKVGKELFTLYGPRAVESFQNLGFEIFLDLKFHDIPATVAKAVKASAKLGVWMVNVHASGGERMMAAAAESLVSFSEPPLLIAVTVLTSMSQEELPTLGVHNDLASQVLSLAQLAAQSGLDGVVCSAHEAARLKAEVGASFKLVTPGIRPRGSSSNDQSRIMTPEEAIRAGSDYLVMGRPITQSEHPAETCHELVQALAKLTKPQEFK